VETSDHAIECIDSLASKFIGNVLKPLNNVESGRNFFVLVDGIDDALLQHERLILVDSNSNDSTSITSDGEMILGFLNKTFLYFPPWLNLVLTSKRSTEKQYLRTRLANVKYEKLAMDKCFNLGAILTEFNLSASSDSNSSSTSSMNAASTIHTSSSGSINESLDHQLHEHSLTHQQQLDSKSTPASTLNAKNPMELCNAAHFANLKDIQTYILKRLDQNQSLKAKFNPSVVQRNSKMNSIELINLLLIKSNYSVLYVEKIFDLILIDFLQISEINAIPVTLNGLYLYLIEKTLRNLQSQPLETTSDNSPVKNNPLSVIQAEIRNQKPTAIDMKDLLYALFGVVLIESRPFDKQGLFAKLSCRFLNLDFKLFELIFEYLSPVFFVKWTKNQPDGDFSPNKNRFFVLCHSSLVDWFTDIKFSTHKYFNNLGESHFVLAFYFYNKLLADDISNERQVSRRAALIWRKFKFHLVNSKGLMKPAASNDHLLNYMYKLCEYDYEHKVVLSTLDRKVLQCQRLLSLDNIAPTTATTTTAEKQLVVATGSSSVADLCLGEQLISKQNVEASLFDFVTRSDSHGLKKYLKTDFYRLVNVLCKLVDSTGQTVLIIAVKLNNNELVDYLLSFRLIDLDHCDANGWTALRYSAWSGKN
jgi:hypothetical protein